MNNAEPSSPQRPTPFQALNSFEGFLDTTLEHMTGADRVVLLESMQKKIEDRMEGAQEQADLDDEVEFGRPDDGD